MMKKIFINEYKKYIVPGALIRREFTPERFGEPQKKLITNLRVLSYPYKYKKVSKQKGFFSSLDDSDIFDCAQSDWGDNRIYFVADLFNGDVFVEYEIPLPENLFEI